MFYILKYKVMGVFLSLLNDALKFITIKQVAVHIWTVLEAQYMAVVKSVLANMKKCGVIKKKLVRLKLHRSWIWVL